MKLFQEILWATLLELGSFFLIILGFMLAFSAGAFIKDESMWPVIFEGGILLIIIGIAGSIYLPFRLHSYIKEGKKKEQEIWLAILFGLISVSIVVLGFMLLTGVSAYLDEVSQLSVGMALISIGPTFGIASIIIGLGGSVYIPSLPTLLRSYFKERKKEKQEASKTA